MMVIMVMVVVIMVFVSPLHLAAARLEAPDDSLVVVSGFYVVLRVV